MFSLRALGFFRPLNEEPPSLEDIRNVFRLRLKEKAIWRKYLNVGK
jgi:hypothetical protein